MKTEYLGLASPELHDIYSSRQAHMETMMINKREISTRKVTELQCNPLTWTPLGQKKRCPY